MTKRQQDETAKREMRRLGDGATGRRGEDGSEMGRIGRWDKGGVALVSHTPIGLIRRIRPISLSSSPRRPVAPSPSRLPAPLGAHRTAAGGFILWEVLLAFGIFCLVSVGLIAALEQTIFTVTLVRDESEIRHDFENFFAEARAEKLQPGSRTLATSDSRIQYERQVQAIKAKNQQGADITSLFQITLTARWLFQNRERTDEAKLIVYQP